MSKIVLITGASSGFGERAASRLADDGHRVYGTSRRAAIPEAEAAPAAGPIMIPMDVGDDASVARAVGLVLEREGRIDVVVNNAGSGTAGAIEDTTSAEARALFETNFFGVHRVCRAVLPAMRARGAGLIINISSLAGRVAIPFQGFYSASKYALEALTESLRMEVAPFGVHATLIEPGDFATGFTDARAVAAAAGDASPYAERCAAALAVMEHDERNGADPALVADLVARLVTTETPRVRYTVGALGQRVAVAASRVLPAGLVERGLRAAYKA